MLVVGLTGGIGSGKSTVTELFAERGVPIVDTDVIARGLTNIGDDAYKKINEHFDNQVILPDGTLNRKKLRKILSDHPEERLWLESLLHPPIRKIVAERIKEIHAPYCIIVIPLLYEAEKFPMLDRILVVDAEEETQVQRVMLRDKLTEVDVRAILKIQATRAQRISIAHDLITNDGVYEDLTPQVDKLHQFYLSLSRE